MKKTPATTHANILWYTTINNKEGINRRPRSQNEILVRRSQDEKKIVIKNLDSASSPQRRKIENSTFSSSCSALETDFNLCVIKINVL